MRIVANKFIQEAREAQKHALRILRENRKGGWLDGAIRRALFSAHYYAQIITHFDTTALRRSHIPEMNYQRDHIQGRLFINRSTRNPKHGESPYKYGIVEHDRGGSHAFYERTFEKLVRDRQLEKIAGGLTRAYNG